MPAPARKAVVVPRTAPAKKATAAVRARREVRAEKNVVAPIVVPYRGEKFEIPLDRLGGFYMRGQFLARFGVDGEQMSTMLFDLLGKTDSARLLNLIRPGDALLTVLSEFTAALNKAGNAEGNSSASSRS